MVDLKRFPHSEVGISVLTFAAYNDGGIGSYEEYARSFNKLEIVHIIPTISYLDLKISRTVWSKVCVLTSAMFCHGGMDTYR